MIGGMKTIPARVLVIESHPLMRAALCAAITAEPDLQIVEPATDGDISYQVTVSSQQEVLFYASKPDAILLAQGNPGWEEIQALKSLRNAYPEIPILALTSNELNGQEQAALAAGAGAVLTKAASRANLIRGLRELLRGQLWINPNYISRRRQSGGSFHSHIYRQSISSS
jgi:DNA-binding NarL/FixJ family response regulator